MDLPTVARLIGLPGSEDALETLANLLPGPVLACHGSASGQATPAARALYLTEPRIAGRENTEAYVFTTADPHEWVVVLADDVQVIDV